MDRTAWIVIGVCAALLGLNIYMGNNKKEEPVPAAPAPVQQTAAAPASVPAPGAQAPAAPSAPEQPSASKALEEDKTSPITLTATQEADGKQEPFITYTFNRIGVRPTAPPPRTPPAGEPSRIIQTVCSPWSFYPRALPY